MNPRLCCAYLRVYLPLSSFPESQREGLMRAVEQPAKPSGQNALGLVAPEECREAYQKVADGELYVCPAQLRLRTLLGMVAFERSLPDGVSSVFFSPEELQQARRELEAIQSSQPGMRPAIIQSPWHVPLRWFVCFEDVERRIEQQDEYHPTIRYQTTVAAAQERVSKALEMLKGGVVHPVIIGMIFELNEWLGTFAGASILELDYASVASLFDAEELADDHSSADVWSAVEALGEGDGMKAGLYYQRANERWARARERESLN